MAKPRATKAKKKKAATEPAAADTARSLEVRPSSPPKSNSVPPKSNSVPPKADSVPPKARSVPPKAASVRPPSPSPVVEPPTPSSAGRWEERGDKDTYALDLLERLVRYYGGRASATSSDAMRSAAVVLSTLSLALASSDDALLEALGRAAREIRKSSG